MNLLTDEFIRVPGRSTIRVNSQRGIWDQSLNIFGMNL